MERLSAPSFITYSDACKLSADIARKSWKESGIKRSLEVTEDRQLIPVAGVKACFPNWLQVRQDGTPKKL